MRWLLVFFCWALGAGAALADRRVSLSWDAPADTNVTDYIVKYGVRSRMYSRSARSGGRTSVTLKNLGDGVAYYFTVTAVNAFGAESDPSEEIIFADPCAGRALDVGVTPIRVGPNFIKLALATLPNRKYEVQATEDFVSWSRVGGSGITGAAGVLEILDSQFTGTRRRFYRAVMAGPFVEQPEALSVLAASPPATGRTISFNATAGRAYEIQSSLDGRSWSALLTSGLSPAGGTVSVQDASTNAASRRYRLVGVTDPLAAYGVSCSGVATRAPSLSTPAAQVTYRDIPTAPIGLTVLDGDSPAQGLRLSASSSNPALVKEAGMVFSGDGVSRSLVITPVRGQAGRCIIEVVVSDGANAAATAFELEVLAFTPTQFPMVVRQHGPGTIAPDLDGKLLTPGLTYTMSAKPAANYIFGGWLGGVTSSAPTLQFVMRPNLSVEAYFVPNPFPAAQGSYYGLVSETNAVRHERAGLVTFKVSSRGTYSGKLVLGGRAHSFSGSLDANLSTTNAIVRKGTNSLGLAFALSGNNSDQVAGSLSDGTNAMVFTGHRSVFNARENPNLLAGAFTWTLPGAESATSGAPEGWSYGTVKVDGNGWGTFAGVLGDGSRASWKTPLGTRGQWPAFASLYAGGGSALGWLTLTNQSTNHIRGDVTWTKPEIAKAKLHAGAFVHRAASLGSSYTRPTGDVKRPSNFAEGMAVLSGGNLNDTVTNVFAWSTKNKVTSEGTNYLSLSFAEASGLFRGSFGTAGGKARWTLGGVVLQRGDVAYGLALGTNRTSRVVIEAGSAVP